MLSLVHQFAPTCIFNVQVHKSVVGRYTTTNNISSTAAAAVGGAAAALSSVPSLVATPSVLQLATAESLAVVADQNGEGASAPLSSSFASSTLMLTRAQIASLAFARDLFVDYAVGQLQPQLRSRWVQRFPAFSRASPLSSSTATSSSSTSSSTTNNHSHGPPSQGSNTVFTSLESLLVANGFVNPMIGGGAQQSAGASQQPQHQFVMPSTFISPLEITPISVATPSSTTTATSTASNFVTFQVKILDTRVASHVFTSVSRHQFVSLTMGKLLMVPSSSSPSVSTSGAVGSAAAKKGGDADDGEGGADDGGDDDQDEDDANPLHFNMDSDLFSKIQSRLAKGAIPEDRSRCSLQYHKEIAEGRGGEEEEEGNENDDVNDANNPQTNSGKKKKGAAAIGGNNSNKRGRDSDPSSVKQQQQQQFTSSIRLTPTGKGPLYNAITLTAASSSSSSMQPSSSSSLPLSTLQAISALMTWIALQVTYVGALSNKEEIPSPFAFAVFKLLSMRLLPNDIVTYFASCSSNYYIRAVGVVAARYAFPPEELVPVLVPTLDGYVQKNEAEKAVDGQQHSSSSLPPSSGTHSGIHASKFTSALPSMKELAAAASAQFHTDLITSPTADDTRSLALLVAEMALHPDAEVCELWFPKYCLIPSRRFEYILNNTNHSNSITNKSSSVNTILLDGIRLRLQRYHEGLQRQKALLLMGGAGGVNTSSVDSNNNKKKVEDASDENKTTKETANNTNKYWSRKHNGGGSVGGGGGFSGLGLRQLKELADLKLREKEMRNLALVGGEDDAFDVASDEDDEDDNANSGGAASGVINQQTTKNPNADADGSSAADGNNANAAAVEDDAELFRRTVRAEARRAMAGLGGGGGLALGALFGGSNVTSQSIADGTNNAAAAAVVASPHQLIHQHASRVVVSLLGHGAGSLSTRADDDLYLQF